MASEQRAARKKPSKISPKEEHSHSLLYRHQNCIPNPNQNCDRHSLLLDKRNKQNTECYGTSDGEEGSLDVKSKSKRFNSKVDVEGKLKKSQLEAKPSNIQQNDGTSEEISKSRRRRLRKQRLLESLAPLLVNPTSSPPVENSSQKRPVPRIVSRPNSGVITVPSPVNIVSEPAKTSSKDSRKRPDKNIGTRNKGIKSKSLIDNTNQYKSDTIKTLEEKRLNSLLQSLVPLTNSSPQKEKASLPVYSFPERRLSSNSAKVDKDSIFYFGETKHQLEKLTTELNKSNSSSTEGDNSETIQNNVNNINNLSISEQSSVETYFPDINEKTINFTTAKQNSFGTNIVPHKDEIEDDNILSIRHSGFPKKKCETPVLKDLSQFPIQVLDFPKAPECTPPTVVKNNSVSIETDILQTPKRNLVEFPRCICSPSLSSLEEASKSSQKTSMQSTENIPSNMKASEETNKPVKNREMIMLEREAKKAAKLAAKTKHKTAKSTELNVSNKDINNTENNDFLLNKTDLENKDNQPNKAMPSSSLEPKPTQIGNGTSSEKSHVSPIEKEISSSVNIIEPSNDSAVKSKAEVRAERRAKQEAQRAVKAACKTVQAQPKEKIIPEIKNVQTKVDVSTGHAEKKTDIAKISVHPKPKLFSHLYREKIPMASSEMLKVGGLHPAIVRLGMQYAARVVVGSNARCIALLHALKQMIHDYITPSEKEFSRGLEEELGPVTVYLNQCRPLAVSMTNALRHIKRTLTQLPNNVPDIEAKKKIRDIVDTYIHEQIDVAGKAICNTVKEKIANGDVILTYGCSSLVYKILLESHVSGTKFRVVVVDGLPWREGREMLRRLVEKGLSCTYVLIGAASFIMREATKVMLGAHALLANGYVMSRAGSSQVALIAHCYNVPVLVCCETHKFSERVQTDAFVYNELGELFCDNIKEKDKGRLSSLTTLSLAYDVTPPDLVSAVVTELAVLPCTSVPVILRIKPLESVM